eukprot:m51a1_g2893 hypothetical protein (221) ;mRNA; r:433876-435137
MATKASGRRALCNSVDASDPHFILAGDSPAPDVDMEQHSPPMHVYDMGAHCEVLFAPGTPLYIAVGDAIMAALKDVYDPSTASKITGMIIEGFARNGPPAVSRLLNLSKDTNSILFEADKCAKVLQEQRIALHQVLAHRVAQRVAQRGWPQKFADRVTSQLLSPSMRNGDAGLDELSAMAEDPALLERSIDNVARDIVALGSPSVAFVQQACAVPPPRPL